MPKTKISEFSATPGNNTDIDGINLAEGCAPSGINDAIRELMAQLKDFQAGTAGDSFNGPVGTTTAAAGAFTNLSASGTFALTGDQVQISEGGTGQTTANAAFNALAPSQATHAGKYLKTDGTNTSWDALDISTADITGTLPVANGGTGVTSSTGTGSVVLSASPTFTGTVNAAALTLSSNFTLSGGTANGVAYLNGSKVLTTGSALSFNGTSLTVGSGSGNPFARINGGTAAGQGGGYAIDRNGTEIGGVYSGSWYTSGAAAVNTVALGTTTAEALLFGINYTEGMRLTSTSLYTASGINVGIGTSSPASGGGGGLTLGTTASGKSLHVYSSSYANNGLANFYGTDGNMKLQMGALSATSAYVFANTGCSLVLYSGGTQNATLDTSGNLGLGVTPSAWLGTTKAFQMSNGAALVGGYIGADPIATVAQNAYFDGSWRYVASSVVATRYEQKLGQHQWFTAGSGTAGDPISFTQAMTLDASGNLGVGTTSPASISSGYTTLDIRGSSGGGIRTGKTGAENGLWYTDASQGWFGTVSNIPQVFYTNNTERARITSGGDFYVAGGGVDTGIGSFLYTAGLCRFNTAGTIFAQFRYSGTQVGSITTDGTSTAYNTSSDYRLKDNPQPLAGSGAFIDALKPKTWDWKSGGKGVGFIAHEVQEVSPASVVGTKDAVDAEGKPVYQAMEYGSAEFIANIIAELQSLRARVAALEGASA